MNDNTANKKRYSLALIVFSCFMFLGVMLFLLKTIFGFGDTFYNKGNYLFKYYNGHNYVFEFNFDNDKYYNLKKHYKFNVKPGNNTDLITDLINTDIQVKKSSDDYVHIDAYARIKSSKLKKLPENYFKMIKNKDIKITEKKLPPSLLGITKSISNKVTIKVPDNILKKLHLTTENGDIKTYNTGKAVLDINSTNGDLIAYGISSNIEASTTNGDISAAFNRNSIKKVKLVTTKGDINLKGLAFENAKFDFYTTNGDITLPNKFSYLINDDKDNVLRVKRGNGKNSCKAYSTNGNIDFEK